MEVFFPILSHKTIYEHVSFRNSLHFYRVYLIDRAFADAREKN